MAGLIMRYIVKHRYLILLFMILLTAAAGACIGRTNINYDLTRYLSSDTMTRRALEVMEEEFGSSEQIRLMFENTPEETVREVVSDLEQRDEILFAAFDPETDTVTRDGITRHLVSLTLQGTDATPLIPELRELMDGSLGVENCYIGGQAASLIEVQNNLAREIPAVMLISVAVIVLVLQSRNTYTFTDAGSAARTESSMIDETFGISNPLVFLVPGGEEDEDYDRQRAFATALEKVTMPDQTPAVGSIASMVTTAGAALAYYTADEIAKMTGISPAAVSMFYMLHGYGESVRADRLLQDAGELIGRSEMAAGLVEDLDTARSAFIGPHYDRMILELNFMPSSKGFSETMDRILETAQEVFGDDFYVTGASMSGYDIGNAFQSDLLKVNLITFLAIFVIVTISFMSWRFALLLVFIIEGAIWITMGISRLTGQSVFFMSYLICLSIQMGATIDYGILFCDQYRTWRRAGMNPTAALGETLCRALPTIITSGTILVTAGAIVGKYCSIYYISSIGSLLSRGAFISALLILTLLPSLLLILDRYILPRSGNEGGKV